MKYSVIYLGHGGSKYIKQTVFSVYTLLFLLLKEKSQDIQIIVYTDDVAAIPKHELITTRLLTKDTLTEFKGPFAYVHRVKLAVLERVAQELDDPFIYVDCDTKWIRHPRNAFQNLVESSEQGKPIVLMHELETPIDARYNSDYFQELIAGFPFQKRFAIKAPPWVMWNSGTIGFYRPGDFFKDCIAITDEILVTTKRTNWTEQLAVSLLASSRFEIRSFTDYLNHYWGESFQLSSTLDQILKRLRHCSSVSEEAAVCANYPLDQQLKHFKHTLATYLQKRIYKLRFSYWKRKMLLLVLLKKCSGLTLSWVGPFRRGRGVNR